MRDTYRSLTGPSEGLYKEKGSKFMALAFPVASEQDIQVHLENARKVYHDARHHCYAYRLGYQGDTFRVQDDGEPSGTAGKPIFGQLLSFDITQVLVIVIRYFGGVKLGTGGLIQAYREATHDALSHADIKEFTINASLSIHFEYPLMNDVMRIIRESGAEITGTDFQQTCRVDLSIRLRDRGKLEEKLAHYPGIDVVEDVLSKFDQK